MRNLLHLLLLQPVFQSSVHTPEQNFTEVFVYRDKITPNSQHFGWRDKKMLRKFSDSQQTAFSTDYWFGCVRQGDLN